MEKISQNNIVNFLDWSYNKVINGLPAFDSAYSLAKEYQNKYQDNIGKQIDSFVNWQCAKAGISGAATGFGGFATMAFTLPANIASVLAIQLRMIATIAILCGYNVKNDKVKILIYGCLVKQRIEDIIKVAGIKISQKIGINLIKKMPMHIIKAINKAIGGRIITKFGQKGIINLGKGIPVLGAVVGATIDVTSTKSVGSFAKKALMSKQNKQNFIDAKIVE